MRLHRLRFDIWLCLLVAYLVSLGTGAAASALSAATYDGYAEVHSAAPGQAGSPAGPEVPRAQSIAELLELDTFTVLSQGIAYRNEGAGYLRAAISIIWPSPPGNGWLPASILRAYRMERTSHPGRLSSRWAG